MQPWLGVAMVLVACPDLPTPAPLNYELGASSSEPRDRPARATSPVLYIDGQPRNSFTVTYASDDAASGQVHTIELRFGVVVLASVTRTLGVDPTISPICGDGPVGPVGMLSESFCEYDSGDLRFGSIEESTTTGELCVGDGLCMPECNVGTCPTGERCTRKITSADPVASHLTCAAIGPMPLGGGCTFVLGIDNCGEQAICIDGSCHATCGLGTTPPDCTCGYVEGVPPELEVCL